MRFNGSNSPHPPAAPANSDPPSEDRLQPGAGGTAAILVIPIWTVRRGLPTRVLSLSYRGVKLVKQVAPPMAADTYTAYPTAAFEMLNWMVATPAELVAPVSYVVSVL